MNLVNLIENEVERKRMLNEASEIDLTREIFELYSTVFENLSDALNDSSNKANIDGNGKVSEDLRKVEVAVGNIKKKLKTVSNSKDKEKFDSNIKKVLGEMANSLSKLKERIDRDIIPHYEQEPEPTINPGEDEEEVVGGEE